VVPRVTRVFTAWSLYSCSLMVYAEPEAQLLTHVRVSLKAECLSAALAGKARLENALQCSDRAV